MIIITILVITIMITILVITIIISYAYYFDYAYCFWLHSSGASAVLGLLDGDGRAFIRSRGSGLGSFWGLGFRVYCCSASAVAGLCSCFFFSAFPA